MHTSLHFERRVYWLGYLGLAPLLLGSSWLALEPTNQAALDFVKAYAAVILTFVGAIHWGRGLHSQRAELVSVSVLPSLLAFACLLLPAKTALPMLAGGFVLQLLLDGHQYRQLPWFRRMRIRLTGIVVALLIVAWLLSP